MAAVSVSIVNGGRVLVELVFLFLSGNPQQCSGWVVGSVSTLRGPSVLWSRAAVPVRAVPARALSPMERKGSPSPRPRRHLFPACFWREPFGLVRGGVVS